MPFSEVRLTSRTTQPRPTAKFRVPSASTPHMAAPGRPPAASQRQAGRYASPRPQTTDGPPVGGPRRAYDTCKGIFGCF